MNKQTKLIVAGFMLLGISPLLSMGCTITSDSLQQPEKLYAKDFANLGIEYRSNLDFSAVRAGYCFRPDVVDDTQEQEQLNFIYGPSITVGYCAPIYLKYIDATVNYGVFADRDLEPGEMIQEYTGKVVKYPNLLPDKGKDYAWNYVDDRFAIDGYRSGNFTRFVNHSYKPNLKWEFIWADGYWHLVYIVAKPIKKDEQLFISYGWKYWRARGIEPEELNTQN